VINSYKNLNPGANLNNFQTPKDFIWMVAYAIDGRYGNDKACLRTVHQYWKNTTASLDREGKKVEPEIINSTMNMSTLFQYVILFKSTTYSGIPPARQYHLLGNGTHCTKPLVFLFIYVNSIFMLYETVIQHVCHQSHLQCESETKKG
jgi:hypothetical protein